MNATDYSAHMAHDFRAQIDDMMWRAAANSRPRTAKQFRMHKRGMPATPCSGIPSHTFPTALNMWLRYQETTLKSAHAFDPWQDARAPPNGTRHHPHDRSKRQRSNQQEQEKARRQQQQQYEAEQEAYMRGFHAYWSQFRGVEGDWEGWYDPESNGSGGTWSFGQRGADQHQGRPLPRQRLPPGVFVASNVLKVQDHHLHVCQLI